MQGCDASEEGTPRHPDAVNGKEDRKKRPPISLATVPEVPRPHEEARLQEPLLRAGTLACRAGLCIVIEAERATHPNTRLLYLRALSASRAGHEGPNPSHNRRPAGRKVRHQSAAATNAGSRRRRPRQSAPGMPPFQDPGPAQSAPCSMRRIPPPPLIQDTQDENGADRLGIIIASAVSLLLICKSSN